MTVVIKIWATGRTEPDGAAARPSKCGRGWGGQAGPADPPGGGPGGATRGTAPVRKGVAMRTLGKPDGPARRAALGGIAAGLMIGLAACGTTVAGSGTAASGGPAARASAGGAAAQPSPSGINPGGVMIGPGPSKDVALCRAIPKLTRMVFMLSTKPPNLHVREVLPAGFPIRDRATVRELATLLCGLPAVPAGRMICPNDLGASYRMFFTAGSRGFGVVTVEMSGCRVVTGLGPPRSWSASTALEQALSQHFGIHFPLAP